MYKSVHGALLTIMIFGFVAMYGANKYVVMREYGDTTYTSNVQQGVINATEVFHQNRTHFNFAFGLFNGGTQ